MEDRETWPDPTRDIAACWPRTHSVRKYDRFVSYADMADVRIPNYKASIWTQLWRKVKRERRKREFYGSKSRRFTYDERSYSQNFDSGLACAGPDDLSRSFSARFAVPSRIFEKPRLMV